MNSSKTAAKVEPARHWINGEWISSSNVAESVSPSTGEVLGQYSAGGRTEAAAAIAAARKAFDAGGWSHDPQLRSRALLELADRLVERADAIALTISRALLADRHGCILCAPLLRELGERFLSNAPRFTGSGEYLQRRLFHTAEDVGRGDLFEALLLERGAEGRSLRRA